MEDKQPRILITRLSHIGDCVLTLPLLHALRRAYPNSYIAWAVESPTQQLLSLVQGLDALVSVPKKWVKRPREWMRLRSELRGHKFDIAIDPQGITKSALLGWLSGARKRIGVKGQWGRELSPILNNRLVATTKDHLVDRSLELLSSLRIETTSAEFELPIDWDADKKIQDYLNESGLGDRFVLINPGASWPSKRWETSRFTNVASAIFAAHGIKSVVVWAGEEEMAMANQIAGESNGAAVVAPKTNLRELAALCAHSFFFVGCDTGPMHIAAAMNTPCIVMYGPTRPQDSGAYGPRHIHLQKHYHAGTSRERRSASNDAMRQILVSEVATAASQMITRLEREIANSNAA